MDALLVEKLGKDRENLQLLPDGRLRLPDGGEYALKPLGELYGAGGPQTSIDVTDERHLRLLMAMEIGIVDCVHRVPSLTDGGVLLAVERLERSPEADPRGDEVLATVQLRLRALLSVDDYSRQEVRQAAGKIRKSIQRHGRRGGDRAYLEFVHAQLHRH